jgi:hypothetical protein
VTDVVVENPLGCEKAEQPNRRWGFIETSVVKAPNRASARQQRGTNASQCRMISHEMPVQDGVAIDEHEVLFSCGGDGPVPNRREAKSDVLVPDVLEGQIPCFDRDHLARGAARSVVGNVDTVWPETLRSDRSKRRSQIDGIVVRRDDKADSRS